MLSFHVSPLEAQVKGSISGKAAIEEDSSDGPTAGAGAGKVRRMLGKDAMKLKDARKLKGKTKSEDPQAKYLRTAEEICGKTLDAPGMK
jgi:hypothetical protein